jgi:hypothetical protein
LQRFLSALLRTIVGSVCEKFFRVTVPFEYASEVAFFFLFFVFRRLFLGGLFLELFCLFAHYSFVRLLLFLEWWLGFASLLLEVIRLLALGFLGAVFCGFRSLFCITVPGYIIIIQNIIHLQQYNNPSLENTIQIIQN